MTQVLDALPTQHPNKMLCHYRNSSLQLQVVRISNIPHWYFERVVFPAESILFEAIAGAILEVHGNDSMTTLIADHIACEALQV